MPSPAYMLIIGETQGSITDKASSETSIGNNWQTEHVNQLMIQEVNHTITIPRDPQTGQPTGQRVHKPLIVTKKQDRSSPLLFNALTRGEKLTFCGLYFYRTAVTGKQELYYSIILTDALLVSMHTRMTHCQDIKMESRVVEEVLEFTYRAIEVTHNICSVSGRDDWREPIVS